jgi:hypothetical protein
VSIIFAQSMIHSASWSNSVENDRVVCIFFLMTFLETWKYVELGAVIQRKPLLVHMHREILHNLYPQKALNKKLLLCTTHIVIGVRSTLSRENRSPKSFARISYRTGARASVKNECSLSLYWSHALDRLAQKSHIFSNCRYLCQSPFEGQIDIKNVKSTPETIPYKVGRS